MAEWQTQQTQNLPRITPREGSSPSSGTTITCHNNRLPPGFKYNSLCHMHSFCRIFLTALLVGLPFAVGQDVGSGAPNATITYAFLASYYRNNFANLVSLPPINNVQKLGASGYVQEFNDAAKTASVKYALILPNTTGTAGDGQYAVFQSLPPVYSYYTQIGVTTAGYPTGDTQSCPSLSGNSCTFQFFNKPYVLFAYTSAVNGGASNYFTRDPFYTKWQLLGGIYTMGPAASAETAFTSAAGNVSTVQTYYQGLIANITSGNVSARTIGVKEPIYDLYVAKGGYGGSMGLPLTDELRQSNGHMRQTFESGTVDYDPNTPGSVSFLLPVKSIIVAPAPVGGTIRLNEGDSATLTATAYGVDGSTLTNRLFTWNTTNGRIVSVQANGNSATIKAIGGGAASVTVSAEGVTSSIVSVFVSAPCCAVGEGAPTPALQQSFQDAITRNKLNPKLPAASPVTRTGAGYVQQFQAADSGDPFWIAAAQSTGNAYLLKGPLLIEYENQGGPSGNLGFPVSDPSIGGRQTFEHGALAGSPVQLVTGSILSKWALLGYDTGSAGNPTGPATPFVTFRATSGTLQTFKSATLFGITSGPQSGKVYGIAGPILAAYTGPSSDLGIPTNDEFGLNGIRHQDFEGGYMEYAPGEAVARIVPAPRVPTVTATPTSAPAGSVVRLALGGFDAGAQIRVSTTGQQDFLATVPTGSYIWENYIPANSATSSVTIKAVDVTSQASSQASYAIRGGNDARLSLKAIGGDTQTGLPGATLPLRVQILYSDDAGNPIPNAPVRFTPSPGGQVGADASTVTDANGLASTSWRLPSEEGVALLSVNASGRLMNVSARATHSGLTNFPSLSQAGISTPLGNGVDPISSKGALLVSATAAIRYYQNRGEMPAPLGLADPAGLNTFLKSACVTDSTGAQSCDGFLQRAGSNDQILNLWRLRGFVNNALDVRTIAPDDRLIRDAIAQGAPVILALTLTKNGAPAGSHFVVATGVDSSGNLALMDPNYGQASFYSYLNGFQSTGATIAGTLTGAAVITAQVPLSSGFLVAVSAPTSIQSPIGLCGGGFVFPVSTGVFALHYCDAAGALFYELDMQPADSASSFQGSFIDLGSSAARADFSGGGAASYAIDHSTGQWTLAPLTVQFQSSGVINSASLTPDMAPGGLASITGTGLAPPGAQPVIAVNGEYTPVLKATPFQLDFQIPADAAAGQAVLDVVSDLAGSAEQTITVKDVAPAIQLSGGGPRKGRIANQDGSANSRYKSATRGQTVTVFGTGFGALAPPRGLATPVHAFVGGTEVSVTSVTQVPNSPGLYQLTLAIPVSLTPGLSLELVLQQGDSVSNAVDLAIQ